MELAGGEPPRLPGERGLDSPLPLGVAEVPGNPALSALLGRRSAVQARAVKGEGWAEQLADVVHHRVDHGNGQAAPVVLQVAFATTISSYLSS